MLRDLLFKKRKLENQIKSLLIPGFNISEMIKLKQDLEEVNQLIKNTKEIPYEENALKLIKIVKESNLDEENLIRVITIELDLIVKEKLISSG